MNEEKKPEQLQSKKPIVKSKKASTKKVAKKKPLSARVLNIVFMAGGLLVCFGVGLWLVININGLTNSIQEQRSQLEALNQREDHYNNLESEFDEIKDDYSLIDQAIPDQNNFVGFISYLERSSQKRSVQTELEFSDQPEVENGLLSFYLKITGSQQNVLKYMKELKNSIYYLEFPVIQLNKMSSKNQVEIEITAKIGIDETFQPSQISE